MEIYWKSLKIIFETEGIAGQNIFKFYILASKPKKTFSPIG